MRALRPAARRIDAAAVREQSSDPHAVAGLLADKAAEGRTVARLIHGDPFESGAGEAAALRARGVPFEVVPGIRRRLALPVARAFRSATRTPAAPCCS